MIMKTRYFSWDSVRLIIEDVNCYKLQNKYYTLDHFRASKLTWIRYDNAPTECFRAFAIHSLNSLPMSFTEKYNKLTL